MAITEVQATLSNQTETLTESDSNQYVGNLEVPEQSGNYVATVSVYDDSGNVAISETTIEVVNYATPKTDWKPTDRFNIQDYNRIKNNLEYVHEKACLRIYPFSIADMGDNMTEYTNSWDVNVFNAFENNVDTMCKNILGNTVGTKKTYYENSVFIDYKELNRIENLTIQMKNTIDNLSAGLRRIPFRMGNFKGFRG